MTKQQEGKYYILLLITSLLWDGNFVAGKFLVGHATSFVLPEMRWFVAVSCLIPLVWWKEKQLSFPKQVLFPLIWMELTGVMLFNLLMFKALADNVGLLSTLNPVSIAVVSYFIGKETLTLKQKIAMFISFVDVMIVMVHGN
ncbi:DMT family transporter [Thermaerobacillus caldiproteolyticus]|uniref:DMT family transporter n=2 Tax=Thermaerobacillus caldiproteolyticus TaxID=247480 RepID=UPI001F4698CC|nr:DMT family transporter [Anoxybacillus caldiproteolyticus]